MKPLIDLSKHSSISSSAYGQWMTPIIYGFVKQISFNLKRSLSVIHYLLISRRSRHFAGCRNLRRGVNERGYVANEVETEQIVTLEGNMIRPSRSSSLVQHRGSIPLYWSHANIFAPSPDIQLEVMNQDLLPTDRHFQRLFQAYGRNVVILNLVRQSDRNHREFILGTAYSEAVDFLISKYSAADDNSPEDEIPTELMNTNVGSREGPEKNHIIYAAYDMLNDKLRGEGSGKNQVVFSRLSELAEKYYLVNGFFTQPPTGHASYLSFPLTSTDPRLNGLSFEQTSDEIFMDNEDEYDLDEDDERGYSTSELAAASLENDSITLGFDGRAGAAALTSFASAVSTQMVSSMYSLGLIKRDQSHDSESTSLYVSFDDVPIEPVEVPTSKIIQNPPQTAKKSSDVGVGVGSLLGLLQNGIFRTNCVDCIDRTNVGQFCYAKTVLPRQLKSLGVEILPSSMSTIISHVMSVWVAHGDAISQQYGGSGAMHKMEDKNGSSQPGEREIVLGGGPQNAVVAVQRYYSNISTDFERQQAMDLILGVFLPEKGSRPVWEMDQRPQVMRQSTSSSDIDDSVLIMPRPSYHLKANKVSS